MRQILKRIVYFLFFAFLLCMPLLSRNDYDLFVTNRALLNVILASGLVFLTGFAGQISLGQAGFSAIGAYTSALVTVKLGLPIPVGILAGVTLSALAGLLVAVPSFKLKAFFLSLMTIAFGQIIWLLLVNLTKLTGGSQGLFNIPLMKIGNNLFSNSMYYYVFLAFAVLSLVLINRIKYSHIGRKMFAVNDDEIAAEACGINSKNTKIMAFSISAALAGLSGSLYAHMLGFLTPEPFVFFRVGQRRRHGRCRRPAPHERWRSGRSTAHMASRIAPSEYQGIRELLPDRQFVHRSPYHHLPSKGARSKPIQGSGAALGGKAASYDLA